MTTYPNQKIIHINKEKLNDFLQIDKDAWIQASNELKFGTFKVYLYLAGNCDGFDLALSPKAINEKLGLSENTCHRAINELIEKHYLVLNQGNIYNFYMYPQMGTYPCMSTVCTHTRVHDVPIDEYSMYPQVSTEIDKRDKIDNLSINKVANAPNVANATEERKNLLKDLSNEELNELLKDYRSEIKYPALYEKYNLCKGELNKELPNTIESILTERNKEEKYSSIKEKLNEDTDDKEELMKLMSVNEDELLEYLSAIEVDYDLYDLVKFLNENEIFTHSEWVRDYAWKEDYRETTYFDWFVGGVNINLLNSQWSYC